MLRNPCKTLGFKKNMVYEIPPGAGGVNHIQPVAYRACSYQMHECQICKLKHMYTFAQAGAVLSLFKFTWQVGMHTLLRMFKTGHVNDTR